MGFFCLFCFVLVYFNCFGSTGFFFSDFNCGIRQLLLLGSVHTYLTSIYDHRARRVL